MYTYFIISASQKNSPFSRAQKTTKNTQIIMQASLNDESRRTLIIYVQRPTTAVNTIFNIFSMPEFKTGTRLVLYCLGIGESVK